MSIYWNTRTRTLSPYIPGEQPQDRTYIKLNTNENPYPPSPRVLDALKQAADQRLRLYPDPECAGLRRAIAGSYYVKPEQVFAGNGSDEVLAFAFAAFFESGSSAPHLFFPDITYSFYPVYARLWGIPYKCPPLKEDFSIDYRDYFDGGGAVFPNPNAPTGMAVAPEDALTIVKYQARKNRVVIIDEAYAGFADNLSLVPLIDENPNLLTVHTLSKSAGLAGLRRGYAIGNEELIEGLCRVRDSFNSYPVDRLALAGGTAAVQDTPYYEAITRKVIATRERVSATLTKKGYTVLPSSANFIFTRSPVLTGAEFFVKLREAGILTRHFNKERIADFLRVSIGTDEEMDKFLEICGRLPPK
jgi:histidinol-phosphate aminotransferase